MDETESTKIRERLKTIIKIEENITKKRKKNKYKKDTVKK